MPAKAMEPVEAANFDLSVNPADDFYSYVNGGWLKTHDIPADKSRYGVFEQLIDSNDDLLKSILEEVIDPSNKPSMLGEFYRSGVDEALSNKAGLTPVQDILDKISGVKTAKDAVELAGKDLHVQQIGGPFWSAHVNPDAKNSVWEILELYQSGLGLPDRDYYFDEDKKEIREKYHTFIADLFQLADKSLSKSDADSIAKAIYDVELELAKSSLTMSERRDPEATYNKKTVKELAVLAPEVEWEAYFKSIGYENVDAFGGFVILDNPKFFTKISELLKSVSIKDWQNYLRFNALRGSAPYLSKEFVDLRFAFYGTVLTGQAEIKPRWKRVLDTISSAIPDSLSVAYIARAFPQEAKAQADELVQLVIAALEEKLKVLDWMEDATRAKALEKLKAMRPKIGFPDKWEDYGAALESAVLHTKPWFENVRLVNAADSQRMYKRVNKPVDRNRWEMPAYMVNAYFHPSLVEIVFPAAILAPPFFFHGEDGGAPAFSFGAIGAVIGHEITHGFDDQGKQFDAHGNLVNWWTEGDAKRFNERAKVIIEQYNEYVTFGQNVKGDLTQGENIADLGGLKIAYLAFQKYQAKHGRVPDYIVRDAQGTEILRLTPEQQVFVSWAQVWRNTIRKENALMRITTDPHSPGNYRANGPLSNLAEFWEAFGVKEGDGMRRVGEKLVNIW
ncbi:endothelin-converting enzyme 1 [Fimicolochytrium jonesii]|uniref:endothelin-converting enzyme 1 n=1 Tax=Fimicolochytrium jonesii TaxID=1396493 RepID=UPI0022FF3CF5|nr:endothelin-converting enzyme 1 [Fimicolochytrium jonesii]KAI8822890.1 endothelin-converting enzyme 1 [Fimicolochytrium jonesii]